MQYAFLAELLLECLASVLATIVCAEELDKVGGKDDILEFSAEEGGDVELPLVVYLLGLALVLHEVDPEEPGVVVKEGDPVAVTFAGGSYHAANV